MPRQRSAGPRVASGVRRGQSGRRTHDAAARREEHPRQVLARLAARAQVEQLPLGARMSITRISSSSRSVPTAALSSAVRAGNLVVLSGFDASSGDGDVVAADDPYAQAKLCLAKAVAALSEFGASVADVIQTRIYLTDANHWQVVARAHREVFEHARPVGTVVVAALLDPRTLVQLEVMAYVER